MSNQTQLFLLSHSRTSEGMLESSYMEYTEDSVVTQVGIPMMQPRKNYNKIIEDWASKLYFLLIVTPKSGSWYMVQKVIGETCRLWFEFKIRRRAWDAEAMALAKQRAQELCRLYWSVAKNRDMEVAVINHARVVHGDEMTVRAVFQNLYVDCKEVQRIFGNDELQKHMDSNGFVPELLRWNYSEEGDLPYMVASLPMCPHKSSVKEPLIKCNTDDFRSQMKKLLGGNAKGTVTPLRWSKLVEDFFKKQKRNEEIAKLQEQERIEEVREQFLKTDLLDLHSLDQFDEKVARGYFSTYGATSSALIEYMNKFFVCVQCAKPIYGVKALDTITKQFVLDEVTSADNLKAMFPHLMVTVVEEEENEKGEVRSRKRRQNLLQVWLENEDHLRVSRMVFRPDKPTLFRDDERLDLPEHLRPMYVNTCPEFAYKMHERMLEHELRDVQGPKAFQAVRSYMSGIQQVAPEERTDLEVILEHVYRVFCKGNSVLFWAFHAFMHRLLRFPGERLKVALIIVGKFGVGKSSFFQHLGEYVFGVGTLYLYFGGDGRRIGGRFNSCSVNGLLTFIDEAENSDKDTESVLKSLITEDFQQVEKKFQEGRQMQNFSNYVYAGNNIGTPIYAGDRRFWVLDCDPRAKADFVREKKDRYWKAISKDARGLPVGMCQYVKWLLNETDLEKFDFNVQPHMTDRKRMHIIDHLSPAQKWWYDRLEAGQLPPADPSPHAISPDLKGAQWEHGSSSSGSDWSGQTSLHGMYQHYRNNGCDKNLAYQSFVQQLQLCLVYHTTAESSKSTVYVSCREACRAQFEIFLREGGVHEEQYEDDRWIKELFKQDHQKRRAKGVGDQPSAFHARCELCSRCSRAWAQLKEPAVAAVRLESLQEIDAEERGELPAVFYKEEGRAADQRLPAAQNGQRAAERGAHDESGAVPRAETGGGPVKRRIFPSGPRRSPRRQCSPKPQPAPADKLSLPQRKVVGGKGKAPMEIFDIYASVDSGGSSSEGERDLVWGGVDCYDSS